MIRLVEAFIDLLTAGDHPGHEVPRPSVPSAGTSGVADQPAPDPQEGDDRLWRRRMHTKTADAFDDEDETDG
jgi:hypothetical protein